MAPKGRKAMAKAPAAKATKKTGGLTEKAVNKLDPEPISLEQKMKRFADSAKKECDVEELVASLSPDQSQLLWKRFELTRRAEGNDTTYKTMTSGAGSQARKHQLLKAWLSDGLTTKGATYKTITSTYTVEKKEGLDGEWRPMQHMINTYGKQELAALVESGAILVRKHPKDPRFYQFKDEIQKESLSSSQKKALQGRHESTTGTNEFLNFMKSDMSGLPANILMDYDMTGIDSGAQSSGDGMGKELLQQLGLKPKKNDKDFDKDLDAMTTVGKDDDDGKVHKKISTLKTMADKMMADLQKVDDNKKTTTWNKDVRKFIALRTDLESLMWEDTLKMKKVREIMTGVAGMMKGFNAVLAKPS